MKIAVLVKRVPDTATVLKIADSGKSVDSANVKFVMSPYDEHAVEEAVRLKEKNGAEVVLVSAGPADTKEILRSGLAMGADTAVLVTEPGMEQWTPRGVAHALAAALKTVSPDLILAGKQAVDDDASQVPERVAELMGLPHVSVITRLELSGNTALADREIEGGHYTYEVTLPALFTAQKGLNTPRYPTLPNIMKAKKKEIREVNAAGLGLSAETLGPRMTVEALALPRQQRLGKILAGEKLQQVEALVKALRDDEKVF